MLLFTIAALFMRNQVRAIRRLAAAAEAFGLGRDTAPIRPEGATEVRRAATAFNRMQERIRRFLNQRTEMLAGVSHDLRTPLTRLRLALAMLPAGAARRRCRRDDGGCGGDGAHDQRLSRLRARRSSRAGAAGRLVGVLEDVAAGARRTGADVAVEMPPDALTLPLRQDALGARSPTWWTMPAATRGRWRSRAQERPHRPGDGG